MRRRTGRIKRVPKILLGIAVVGVVGYIWLSRPHPIPPTQEVAAGPRSKIHRASIAHQRVFTPKGSPYPTAASALPTSYLIRVPAKDQYPQLPNGCEVTSLAMLMTAVGHPVSKMTLAHEMPVDPTKLVLTSYTTSNGQVVHKVQYWGNPNVGFVGSVYQAGYGYGIYNGPMARFLNRLLPGRAENLTDQPFSASLRQVAEGIPVEAWTTTTFQPTTDWVTWRSPEGLVHATPWEHAVLIVGYAPGYLYINNPLNGEAAQKVAEAPFIEAWKQLGEQALTVKK